MSLQAGFGSTCGAAAPPRSQCLIRGGGDVPNSALFHACRRALGMHGQTLEANTMLIPLLVVGGAGVVLLALLVWGRRLFTGTRLVDESFSCAWKHGRWTSAYAWTRGTGAASMSSNAPRSPRRQRSVATSDASIARPSARPPSELYECLPRSAQRAASRFVLGKDRCRRVRG
jgi:hypothetical protein